MSSFELRGALTIDWLLSPPRMPMWGTVPSHSTPSSDGEPIFCHSDTRSACALPPTEPLTQSMIGAPVFRPDGLLFEVDSRTAHGSGVPRGLSSRKSFGVPRSSKAFFRLNIIVELIDAHVTRSSG